MTRTQRKKQVPADLNLRARTCRDRKSTGPGRLSRVTSARARRVRAGHGPPLSLSLSLSLPLSLQLMLHDCQLTIIRSQDVA